MLIVNEELDGVETLLDVIPRSLQPFCIRTFPRNKTVSFVNASEETEAAGSFKISVKYCICQVTVYHILHDNCPNAFAYVNLSF
jgi:hypothetical protein